MRDWWEKSRMGDSGVASFERPKLTTTADMVFIACGSLRMGSDKHSPEAAPFTTSLSTVSAKSKATKEEETMRWLLLATLALIIVAPTMTFETDDANAAVCGRGAHRAGCVGPRGAVGVGPRGAVGVGPHGGVVGRRYGPGIWYGTGRRFWHGEWYAYGVGPCWAMSPVGYVWICQ
jgi:hypothetical protein